MSAVLMLRIADFSKYLVPHRYVTIGSFALVFMAAVAISFSDSGDFTKYITNAPSNAENTASTVANSEPTSKGNKPDVTATSSSAVTPVISNIAPATTLTLNTHVSDMTFASAVNNHEPADDLKTLDNSYTRIYFYVVLNNLQDQEVTFRWTYNGVTQSVVKQIPKRAYYRTYTSKELDPSKLGTWKVDILDDSGKSLGSKTFEYTKASEASTAAPAPTPSPDISASIAEPAPSDGKKPIDITSAAGMFAAGVFLLSFCMAILLILIAVPCYLFAKDVKVSERSGFITKICLSYILGCGVASFAALGLGLIKPFPV